MDEEGIPIDEDALEEKFNLAANFVTSNATKLQQDDLLYLYGRYKQALTGPCKEPIPSIFNFKGRSKWYAWSNLGDMSKNEAMNQYTDKLTQVQPKWNDTGKHDKKSFGPVASTCLNTDPEIREELKTVFDYVKEDNLNQLKKLLTTGKLQINCVDEDGLSLLHWASDRGYVNIVSFLITSGIDVDCQDVDGQTALHYASSCGHNEVVTLLIKNKACVDIKDTNGSRPYDVAYNNSVKDLLTTQM